MIVYDISDPAVPVVVGSLALTTLPTDIAISGRYLYLVEGTNGIKVIDISNPVSPTQVSSQALGTTPTALSIAGRYAYVVDSNLDTIAKIDLTGIEVTSGIVHSLEAGSLQVRENAVIQQNLSVGSALNVGLGGIFSAGPISAGVASSTQTGAISALFKGSVGVGTTSPWRTFSVDGTVGFSNLTSNIGAAAASLCLDSNNQVTRNTDNETCITSSKRYKNNILDIKPGVGLTTLKQLIPITYEFNNASGTVRHGLIAEDVEAVNSQFVSYDDEGLPSSVRYLDLIPLQIQALQDIAINLETIASTTITTSSTPESFASGFFSNLFSKLVNWFANTANGIGIYLPIPLPPKLKFVLMTSV